MSIIDSRGSLQAGAVRQGHGSFRILVTEHVGFLLQLESARSAQQVCMGVTQVGLRQHINPRVHQWMTWHLFAGTCPECAVRLWMAG